MAGRRGLALAALLALPRAEEVDAQVDPEKHQAFADALTSRLYSNPNECSSALGVSMCFSLLYPGCTNQAVDEVRKTLGYPGGDNLRLVWEGAAEALLEGADGGCLDEFDGTCYSEAPLLKIASSVWFDSGDALQEDYADVVGEYAMQTNFTEADSPLVVNEWVNESTNGLIDSIVDPSKPLFPPDVLIAINSIYLKAQWSEQFEEGSTNLDAFYSSPSRSAKVGEAHFMHNVEYFDYSDEALEGYQVVDLPFKGSTMSMILVLPMIDGMEAVRSTDLISALDRLEERRVALSLPKFKFASEYADDLKQALIDSGIQSPFAEGTESLCGMLEEYDCAKLIVTKIVQKTVIDVNEKGVEAAAVTAASVGLTSAGPPPEAPTLMALDHPFQFFVYDQDEGIVLFEGRVGDPGVPEAEPAVALSAAVHSDEDFWSSLFGVVDLIDPAAAAAMASSGAAAPNATTDATTTEAPDATATTAAPNVTTSDATTAATTPGATTAAATPDSTTTAETPPEQSDAIDPTGHQEFADELTSLIFANDNECSSSLGVSMALSLVWPGTAGDAVEQMREALRYPAGTNARLVWEEIAESMLASSDGGGKEGTEAPLLMIANSVWYHDEYALKAEYEDVVGRYAVDADFASEDSPIEVNEWVEESTNGLITGIVPEGEPLFPPYVLLAINSIYLKARWAEQFQERYTNLDSFYDSASSGAEVSKAHFMNMVEEFAYSDTLLGGAHQVISLPFDGSSRMSMIFVLPIADDAGTVNSTDLIPAMGGMQKTRVALSVPKFRFESTYDDLKTPLMRLGIESPFTEGTGALCGLFEDADECEKAVVDKVMQKTVIDVNERGVEAAAVTAVVASVTSLEPPPEEGPVLVVLDHPFQFFVFDGEEGLMLFEGRVGAPQVPEAEPAVALLEGSRSDDDFWSRNFGVEPVGPSAPEIATTAAPEATTEATTPAPKTSSSDATTDATTAGVEPGTAIATTEAPATGGPGTTAAAAGGPSTTDAMEASSSTTAATATATTTTTTTTTTTSSTTSSSSGVSGEPDPIQDSAGYADRRGSGKHSNVATVTFLAFALAFAW